MTTDGSRNGQNGWFRFFRAGWTALRAPMILLCLPALVLIGPAVIQREIFCYRDAGHYYFPLYAWTAERWGGGEIPLWDPLENGGRPAFADATTGCFYPLRLLFILPVSAATRYTVFLGIHLPIAAVGTWLVARRWWQLEWGPSLLAGAAYAYGGAVIFQHCNAVFLIGAAWLPLAVGALERLLVTRRLRWISALSTAMAMMILGGDPQLAYHLLILGGVGWLVVGGVGSCREIGAVDGPAEKPNWWRRRAGSLLLLAAAALLAIALAAVQFLPALEWARASERVAFDRPRNVFERYITWLSDDRHTPAEIRSRPAEDGLFGSPAADSHLQNVYRFSHPPWRILELLWPNCFGRLFPENHRWSAILADESGTWTPSSYLGLIPLLLAVSTWSLRSPQSRVRLISWIGCVSLVASWGGFGIGWIVRQTLPSNLSEGWSDPVGGLYWLMVVCLPGYVYFRYPAKWLIPFALATAMLAGIGAQRLEEIRDRLRKWLDRTALLSAVLLAAALTIRLTVAARWANAAGDAGLDDWLGPVEWKGAMTDLSGALAHGMLIAIMGSWILRRAWSTWRCGAGLAILTVVDLVIAAAPLIATAPVSLVENPPMVRSWIEAEHARAGGALSEGELFRTYRPISPHWLPESWSRHGSPRRLVDSLAWDHATLFPRHALRWGISSLESPDSIASLDWSLFLETGKKHGGPPLADGSSAIPAPMLDLLAARTALLPAGLEYPGWLELLRLDEVGAAVESGATLWSNPMAMPRVRIVHRVQRLSPLADASAGAVRRRTEEVLFSNGAWRDFRNLAVVECDARKVDLLLDQATDLRPSESDDRGAAAARILVDRPECCVVEAELGAPGLLVIADSFCPGWRATLVSVGSSGERPAEILRTNRVQRGVVLPAGRHRVTLRYRPPALAWGMAISMPAWAVLFFYHARLLFLPLVAFGQRAWRGR